MELFLLRGYIAKLFLFLLYSFSLYAGEKSISKISLLESIQISDLHDIQTAGGGVVKSGMHLLYPPYAQNRDQHAFLEVATKAAQKMKSDENNIFYRGMRLYKEDLDAIFKNGMKYKEVKDVMPGIFVSSEAYIGVAYSLVNAPADFVTDRGFYSVVFKFVSHTVMPEKRHGFGSAFIFPKTQIIKPDEIKEVYVFDKNFKKVEDAYIKL